MTLFAIITATLLLGGLGYPYVPWWGNALLAIWIWLCGANVGSFMNVVVYRIPLGYSVVHPRSRCPKCLQPISWYDNLPVLSWLVLRARCRSCAEPISSRYPTVEALVGGVFLMLALVAPITSGDNLPEIQVAPPLRLQTMFSMWLMFALHILVLCTLICAALIRYDRQTPPLRLFAPAFAVGIAAPMIWPELRPVPFFAPVHLGDRWVAVLDACAGLTVAAALGLFVVYSVGRGRRNLEVADIPAVVICGLALGWQAVCVIACFAAVAHFATRLLARLQPWFGRVPWTTHLSTGVLVYVACWGVILDRAEWLSSQATIATFALAAIALIAVNMSTAALRPEPPESAHLKRNPGERPMSPEDNLQAILDSPSYRLAELDTDFLRREELRPVRLQLELLKPEMVLAEQQVESTIVTFGGTQVVQRKEAEQRLQAARTALESAPDDSGHQRNVQRAERVLDKAGYYDAAREFAQLVSSTCQNDHCDFVITTGGGPGIMEAANRGAADVGGKSIGLNITLPQEQAPNPFITPELCFQFHYFALRKMHFLFRAKALVVFPGGFGTLDELFDALTLRQTNRMQAIPIILFGRAYWERVIDFQFLADEGVIRDDHLDLISYAETPQEAWEIIATFHGIAVR